MSALQIKIKPVINYRVREYVGSRQNPPEAWKASNQVCMILLWMINTSHTIPEFPLEALLYLLYFLRCCGPDLPGNLLWMGWGTSSLVKSLFSKLEAKRSLEEMDRGVWYQVDTSKIKDQENIASKFVQLNEDAATTASMNHNCEQSDRLFTQQYYNKSFYISIFENMQTCLAVWMFSRQCSYLISELNKSKQFRLIKDQLLQLRPEVNTFFCNKILIFMVPTWHGGPNL